MSEKIVIKTRQAGPGIKPSGGDIAFNIINYTIFGLFTLVCVFPFYYLFINTISDNQISGLGDVMFYPKGIHFNNYVQVMKIRGIGRAAFLSVGRTIIGTGLMVISSACCGYLFTKEDMWMRKFWYRFVVVTMYFNAGIIPWYITMNTLKLTNNFWAYILPTIVSPFNIILVKTFVESVPKSLEESAELDGAGFGIILTRIIIPLIKPILATIAIFGAVSQWNAFTDTLFLMSDAKYFTLQFLLYRYLNEAASLAALLKSDPTLMANLDLSTIQTPDSVRMTVSMVVVLPILFVYPYFQRYFVKGIMIGAVKG
jgi:putative aldouronate transport system permease protein